MSNVLDYRFFDTEKNCYVENKAAFCICQGKVCETLSGHFEEEKSIIVEQSTGLKDKNGKLIFEGDIVFIAIEEDYAKIKREIDVAAFVIETNDICWSFDDFCSNELEVIGNIHEKKYDDN